MLSPVAVECREMWEGKEGGRERNTHGPWKTSWWLVLCGGRQFLGSGCWCRATRVPRLACQGFYLHCLRDKWWSESVAIKINILVLTDQVFVWVGLKTSYCDSAVSHHILWFILVSILGQTELSICGVHLNLFESKSSRGIEPSTTTTQIDLGGISIDFLPSTWTIIHLSARVGRMNMWGRHGICQRRLIT